jgi:hypothetical protein
LNRRLGGLQIDLDFSETRNIQTPGNYPKESIQHSEHGESLKLRILYLCGEENARYKIHTPGNYPEENIQKQKHLLPQPGI